MASGHVRLKDDTIIRAAQRPDKVLIRIERPEGLGRPRYEIFEMSIEEANGLKTVLEFIDIEDES